MIVVVGASLRPVFLVGGVGVLVGFGAVGAGKVNFVGVVFLTISGARLEG